jgi:hypothetical protein
MLILSACPEIRPEVVAQYGRAEKSIMARFALYADHCHLSPLGNRLLAEQARGLLELVLP